MKTIIEKAHIAVSKIPRFPNIVPKKVAENIKVNLKSISFEVDPIQNYTMQLKVQKLPVFAEAMNRNLTGIYFHFLDYKVEKKEPSILEWKGGVRTGKTTGAISTHKYIGQMSGVEFTIEMICPNEQYFVQRIPYAANNTSMIVDEQMEQHTGLGCLTAGHKVFTDIGWISIEDLETQPKRKVLSMNSESKFEWSDFKFMKYKTKLSLYEITIEGGGRLIVTPEHKFPIFDGSKCSIITAENLKQGSMLRIVNNVKPLKSCKMNTDFAELIGLLIAEGSLSKIKHDEDGKGYRRKEYYRENDFYHYAVKFYNKDVTKIAEFKQLFAKLYPECKLHQFKRERDIMLITNNKKVFEECSKFIPVGKKSAIVEIPKEIFMAQHEAKRMFIRGLYLGDGSVYLNETRKGRGMHITYYSKSEQLCRGIKLLLLEFGIKSQIRSQFNPKGFKPFIMWTTRVTSKNDIKKFLKFFMNMNINPQFVSRPNFRPSDFRKIITIKKASGITKYVYDIEVFKNHNFIVEGILSKNSFREMQHTEDLNNIIAKNNISVSWIHPPEFVGRNAFYGLETAGRNFEHKLTKFLIYDLTQKTFGISSIPLGFVIIPKYDDIKFETEYERRKDLHIDALKNESIAVRQQSRLDEGFALAKNKLYQRMKNNHQKIQLARRLFPMRTEGEYMELVSIANMNIKLGINQADFDNAKTQVDKDLKDLRKAKKE